jgi:putative membrane protein
MRHFCSFLLPSVLALFAATAASAESDGNAAGMSPSIRQAAPGVPAPHELNTSDRVFMRAAATGGLAEVDFGELAGRVAQTTLVKGFARRMVTDHDKTNQKLSELAAADQFPLPSKLDEEHRLVRENLQKLTGDRFERAYMDSQLQDHRRTAQLLAYEVGSGENAELKAFAEQSLPVVLEHLQMAQDIDTKLWGVGPQGAAPGLSITEAKQ